MLPLLLFHSLNCLHEGSAHDNDRPIDSIFVIWAPDMCASVVDFVLTVRPFESQSNAKQV